MQPLGARSLLLAYLLSATTTAYPSSSPTEFDTSAFTCLAGDYDQAESCRVSYGEGQNLGTCTKIQPMTKSSRALSVKNGSGPNFRCKCDS